VPYLGLTAPQNGYRPLLPALETSEEQKGPFDWRLAFFPWYEGSRLLRRDTAAT
jgi:hypothetical protein